MLGGKLRRRAAAGVSTGVLLAVSTVSLLTIGASNAGATPIAPTAKTAPPVGASPDNGNCEWKNARAYPKLYIRKDPNTDSESVGSIPWKHTFTGSCNLTNGFIFVEDQPTYPLGWANAHYCDLILVAVTPSVGSRVMSARIASRS